MKCIACDSFLAEAELTMIKEDGDFEDMCYVCRGSVLNVWGVGLKEYHHQHLTDLVENYYYVRNSRIVDLQ